MKDSVTERIERFLTGHPLFDQAVVQHGFTRHLRDYDVIVDRVASLPKSAFDAASDRHSYVEARCRYRFTHCVGATVETKLTDETWRVSWDDHFIDLGAWKRAGEPEGFIFGVQCADAYPGGRLVHESALACDWSGRLGHQIHEAVIETNTCALRLVFHDLCVTRIAVGDAATGDLKDLDVEKTVEPTDDL
jgi:hypothetical protein